MNKKWKNLNRLYFLMFLDDTLGSCEKGSIRKVTYAPNIGYRAWIFRYKGTPVCLSDMGNGHYSFHSAVSWIDILVAKIQCMCMNSLRSGM